jgi:hypothetical protein
LPKLSRYSAITLVLGSSDQYDSRSLTETSALLPIDANSAIPSWRLRAWSIIARPSAPLCVAIDTLPVGGDTGLNVAFSRTDGSVESTPMQFGPTMRIPPWRAISRSRCSTSRPALDASAKPAEITTTLRTPAAAQSRMTCSTAAAGTATIARSTGAPIAAIEG